MPAVESTTALETGQCGCGGEAKAGQWRARASNEVNKDGRGAHPSRLRVRAKNQLRVLARWRFGHAVFAQRQGAGASPIVRGGTPRAQLPTTERISWERVPQMACDNSMHCLHAHSDGEASESGERWCDATRAQSLLHGTYAPPRVASGDGRPPKSLHSARSTRR